MKAPPLFSVVIPTFQRPEILALCLDRVAPGVQTLEASHYEVIVADAGTHPTVEAMLQEHYPWARWAPAPGSGPAANRNAGARQALGEWVAFVDDDCLPELSWLSAYALRASCDSPHVMEGRILVKDKIDSPFRRQPENPAGGVFWSGNLAVRRDTFWRLGGFDEDFVEACEDMEFAVRIRRSGLMSVFCPDALVYHPSQPEGLRGLLRRTALLRWHLLLHIKTGLSPSLGASSLAALRHLLVAQFINLLRTTWHCIHQPNRELRRTQLFAQMWTWTAFPILLPYLMLWELRFRRQLRGITRLF